MLVFCSSSVLFICVCWESGVWTLFNLAVLTNIAVKFLDKFSLSCAIGFPDPISTSGQCPYTPPRIPVSCSTACAFPSYTPDWPTPFSCLPCFISYTWELNTCTQRTLSSESCQPFLVPWERFPRGCHSLIPYRAENLLSWNSESWLFIWPTSLRAEVFAV